jgi:hypothetical protein
VETARTIAGVYAVGPVFWSPLSPAPNLNPRLDEAEPSVRFASLDAGFYSTGVGSAGTRTALNRAPRQATVSTPRMVISSLLQPNVRT